MTEAVERLARETMEDWAFKTPGIQSKVYGSDLEKLVAKIARALREAEARGLERARRVIEQGPEANSQAMLALSWALRNEAHQVRDTLGTPLSESLKRNGERRAP